MLALDGGEQNVARQAKGFNCAYAYAGIDQIILNGTVVIALASWLANLYGRLDHLGQLNAAR